MCSSLFCCKSKTNDDLPSAQADRSIARIDVAPAPVQIEVVSTSKKNPGHRYSATAGQVVDFLTTEPPTLSMR